MAVHGEASGCGDVRAHLSWVAGATELVPIRLELERELLRLRDILLRLGHVGLLGGERGALKVAIGVGLNLQAFQGNKEQSEPKSRDTGKVPNRALSNCNDRC